MADEKKQYKKWVKKQYGIGEPTGWASPERYDWYRQTFRPESEFYKYWQEYEAPKIELSEEEYKNDMDNQINELVLTGQITTAQAGKLGEMVGLQLDAGNQPSLEELLSTTLGIPTEKEQYEEQLRQGRIGAGQLGMEQAEFERGAAAEQEERAWQAGVARQERPTERGLFKAAQQEALRNLGEPENWIKRWMVQNAFLPQRGLTFAEETPYGRWRIAQAGGPVTRPMLEAGYLDPREFQKALEESERTGLGFKQGLPVESPLAAGEHYWPSKLGGPTLEEIAKRRYPPTPEWLPKFAPQLAAGKPARPYKMKTPSLAAWGALLPSQKAMLAGYAESAGQSMEDIVAQMQAMAPRTPPARRWTRPMRQWG